MRLESVLAIIPARGDSKSIPRKNLVSLGGKPLLAWPIELARSVTRIERVIVSTDDNEITKVAKHYGAEVPFKRPASLSTDDIPTLPVLQHCLSWLEKHEGYRPDIILLLYATTPFIRKSRIEEALDVFEKSGCNSVMGVQKDWGRFWRSDGTRYSPFYPKRRLNRQQYTPLLREAGNMYFSRLQVIIEMNTVIDEVRIEFLSVEHEETIDIDTRKDLQRARLWLKEHKLRK
ncbi:MAG: hypothetical protein A3A65_02925 [Candidatus Chisholmbacteria bacterium RIFCSPLOWO2_01_FULL_49_14]|uniref:CMP-N-acetylneuraminic acid synthetase n=1 Tax=Candidatus Chisholmbacteria bacterium RIFCSPLOWO2_01_FULL_49_14 TaxID=1797593 RepID=A0A1G1W2W4_9BACT|nr:MAG: hypothetical protein A3A65_02925 [Candidatus Chisholmbacteria bacterium RIFCSPLOWO2_01_FULL_49_14]